MAASYAETVSLVPPVALPNGEEFKTWRPTLKFARTFYVDQRHPRASDDNSGTRALPFRTINRAAQVLQPGERVVVAAGVYRERVAPTRGGSAPDRMISYEATPGARVTISGSRVLKTTWAASRRDGQPAVASAWMARLPRELFEDENPFAEINLTDAQIDRCMDWAVPIKGKPPITLRRGLVFQHGQRLKQVVHYDDLAKSPGAYWVETDGQTLHVRPLGAADPNAAQFEVTTQGFVFAPRTHGLGYIRVRGFTIQHAGNCFPRPQQGALSTRRGHHWLIEDNTVQQCNSIGMDIGDQFDTGGPELAEGGRHIVRRNHISDCGIGGIEGKLIEHTLIEDNVIRRCGWHDIWRLYECGGIKVHCTRSCVLRRNLVTNTIAAPGIWMDYDNVNSRCTANVIVNADCSNGGIFMEASQKPNLVDNNFVWATRGNGIYQHDCDELIIAHNLVAHSTEAAVQMRICKGRKVLGRLTTAKRNRILNNLFLDNAKPPAIADPDNVCDHNVFATSKEPFDLAAWQSSSGWDKHSVAAHVQTAFDSVSLAFRWTLAKPLPQFPCVEGVASDLLGRSRMGERALPGPFATSPRTRVRLR